MMEPILGYFKLAVEVDDILVEPNPPLFATDNSACFDLSAFLPITEPVKIYLPDNTIAHRYPMLSEKTCLYINPGERALVPTGLILDIPTGYSVRLHVRSSLALKAGLTLANSEGVIDSDYVDEIFVLIYNRSTIGRTISIGERIAQAELVKSVLYKIEETKDRPSTKTNRTGKDPISKAGGRKAKG